MNKYFWRGFLDGLTFGPLWRYIAKPYILAERAACAKLCKDIAWSNQNSPILGPENNCMRCAAAIMERSNGELSSTLPKDSTESDTDSVSAPT